MTSGTFNSIPISSIIINRAERQRKEIPNVEVLADSLRRLGLIHPIVITRDSVLVAGERRLAAATLLGWTTINCQFLDELDPTFAHAIELEENIKREALPWQDECRAVAEYHALRQAEEPAWSQEQTAEALGLTQASISQKLSVARELRAGNKMVAEAPRYSTAHRMIARAESRKDDAALLALSPKSKAAVEPDSILNADFNKWAPTYDGPKFNFLHCDFPYGINADKFNQGAAASHGGYADDEGTYWALLQTLAENQDRLCAESCHIMFWFSMHFYTETKAFFAEHTDFKIDPFPLIWMKSDNVGILPDPERGPRRLYESCLFGSRGDRKIVRAASNAVFAPSQRDEHMSIKPEEMLIKFFGMFVDSSTNLLDPTCGSGGALRAAERLSAACVTGLEKDPDFAERANLALRKARLTRKEKTDEEA